MATHQSPRRSHTETEAVRRLRTVTDPALLRYIAKLRGEFEKYATTAEETQRLVAHEMGNMQLTDVLREMRREQP